MTLEARMPPLGYDIHDRKLVINTKEATIVRRIYERYLALGSVRALKQELDAARITSKLRPHATGRWRGGKPFARGALYRILQNRIYLGEIVHKEKSYRGEHQPIIEMALWNRVQERLKQSRVEKQSSARTGNPSMLTGLLFDGAGERMTPTHAAKHGTRYRYYVSRSLLSGRRKDTVAGRRVLASKIETLVVDRLRIWLSDPSELTKSLKSHRLDVSKQTKLIAQAARVSANFAGWPLTEQQRMLARLISRVDLMADRIQVHISVSAVAALLAHASNDPIAPNLQNHALVLRVPARLKRVGMEIKLVFEGQHASKPDAALIKLVTKAQGLYAQLLRGDVQSIHAMAAREAVTSSYITRVLRLSFLAPDVTTAIVNGHHPAQLNAAALLSHSRLPLDWTQQRALLGFR
jgi:site-specific DNA recombinase